MTDRIIKILVIVALAMPVWGNAYAEFGGGTGTECDPYIISTETHLRTLADNVNGGTDYSGIYFKVANDIGSNTNPFKKVIGNVDSKPFRGNFDGGAKTIYLEIESDGFNRRALFGYIGSDANIKNVKTKGSVEGYYAAGIVGYIISGSTDITINNCTNGAKVSCAGSCGGGIVCEIWATRNVTITGCVNDTAVSTTGQAGGIVGVLKNDSNVSIKIQDCTNTIKGVITGGSGIGGIVGEGTTSSSATSEITNCKNYGPVTSASSGSLPGSNVGGIVGRIAQYLVVDKCQNYSNIEGFSYNIGGIAGGINNGAVMRNSFNRGRVKSTIGSSNWNSNGIGGVVGYVGGSSDKICYVDNCYNIGEVYAGDSDQFRVGGVVGYITYGYVRNCYTGNTITGGNKCTNCSDQYAYYDRTGNIAGMIYAGGKVQHCHFLKDKMARGTPTRISGEIYGSNYPTYCYIFSHASNTTNVCTLGAETSRYSEGNSGTLTFNSSTYGGHSDLVGALNYWRTNLSGNPSLYTEWVDDASPWENLGMPKFKACTPITITTFNVTPGNEQNTLAWEASGTASSYTIYWECPSSVISPVGSSPYSHTGLTAGNEYCYEVMAVGTGDNCAENAHSTRICRTVPTCIPPAVENFAVTQPDAKGRKLQVSWTPEANITYKLYYGVNNPALGLGGLYEVPGTVTPAYTVERLTNGQPYYFVLKPIGGDYCDGIVVYPSTVTPQCNE